MICTEVCSTSLALQELEMCQYHLHYVDLIMYIWEKDDKMTDLNCIVIILNDSNTKPNIANGLLPFRQLNKHACIFLKASWKCCSALTQP